MAMYFDFDKLYPFKDNFLGVVCMSDSKHSTRIVNVTWFFIWDGTYPE